MRERSETLRFPDELFSSFGIGSGVFEPDLERDEPIQFGVERAVHLARRARAEQRRDFVGAKA